MKKILIITTPNDLSIPLFSAQDVKQKIELDFCFFHQSLNEIKNKLAAKNYDFIYLRDPFTYPYEEQDLRNKINFILKNSKNSYLIDRIENADDIFFEDKYVQYQLFSAFMPKTKILEDLKEFKKGKFIIKKRISSRGKGIFFDLGNIEKSNLNNYILQQRLDFEKEYRVYVIFNQILTKASIKNTKSETNKVKIIGAEEISAQLKEFVKKIITNNKFDFIGLDIGISQSKPYLIEVNRSCLFNVYFEQTGVNLAKVFIEGLLKRHSKPSY